MSLLMGLKGMLAFECGANFELQMSSGLMSYESTSRLAMKRHLRRTKVKVKATARFLLP